jgi:ketosteroid isomerase-like protein
MTATAIATWERDVRELEARHHAAFLAADLPTLERLWADGFLVNSPLDVVSDKARVLELLQAGRIRHTTYTYEIEHLRRHGDVVVVMGQDRVTNPPDDTPLRRRFTNVWQWDGVAWRCIARHAHVVPPGR